MRQLLVGSTLLASFLGGVVALLAPCCVSVMLPAFFATGFVRRVNLLAATGVFTLGVATVILPLALGASAISAAISGHHLLVYSLGGAAMIAGGVVMLAGGSIRLPMPGGRPVRGRGPIAVYGLGVFSGAASACCAPVLAGVVLLSGAAGSFAAALAVGAAYVAGMVAPLTVVALLWDRGSWGRGLLTQRTVRLSAGSFGRRLPLGTAAGGLLLVAMGLLAVVLALVGPSMPTSGWRVTLVAELGHYATRATHALGWLPGWVVAAVLLLVVAALIRYAIRQRRRHTGPLEAPAPEPDLEVSR